MNAESIQAVVDLAQFMGIGQFGGAYETMLDNDTHAPDSVDRVLMRDMVKLCRDTAQHLYTEYSPTRVTSRQGTRPELERHLRQVLAGARNKEDKIEGIAAFCARLGERAIDDIDAMRIGGTEEEIIERGSDWCTDVARVACALCQVAGLPSRLVYLFDPDKAYSGHAITEVHRRGAWGAIDAITNVVYRHRSGAAATTWELMSCPDLVRAHYRGPSTLYTTPDQFKGAGIVNYFVWERERYDYTVSSVNEYYRSILQMSLRGWPGGLRWLHGEQNYNLGTRSRNPC